MQGSQAERWSSEGFVRTESLQAVLPWQTFSVDVEVGVERELPASDATILELLALGVAEPERLRVLMGLEDDRLVTTCLARLLRKSAVARDGRGFILTPGGETLRRSGRSIGVERTSEVLHYDAIRGRFDWSGHREVSRVGPHHVRLPLVEQLTAVEVERAVPRLQTLVQEAGVPSIAREDRREQGRTKHELRALRVVSESMRWREVRLELWQQPATGQQRLRVCTSAGEDGDATLRFDGYAWDAAREAVVARR